MSEKNKTLLIVREPNVDIPEAFLRKVIKEYPNGGGYSVQKDGELVTDHSDTGVVLTDIQDLMKSAASYRILFAFNKLEKTEEKFLQPFNLAAEGDDTLISFGIDGAFPKIAEAGWTEEALLARRVMFPNIQKLVKFSGSDLDKFIAELRDPAFVEMLMSRIDDRAAFCFLPPVGEAIWYGKYKDGSTFPWGQVSNTLGYVETPATATAEVAGDKKKGWWGKSKGPELPVAQDPPQEQPAAPAAPPPSPGPLNIPAATPDTKVNPPEITPAVIDRDAPPPPGHWEVIPKGLNRDQRKKLIRRVTNCGSVLPNNWNVDPFRYWQADYPQDESLKALANANKASKAPKDMRAPAPKPAPTRGSDVDILLMSKDERSAIETHILNVLGFNAKNTKTPVEIQKEEATYAKFSDEFGIKTEILNNWTPKQLRLLGPKGMVHLLLEYRRKDIERIAAAAPAESAAPADAVADPAAASSAAPTQKKGYWGKPKAA